jgi:hypothetical protein
MLDLFGKLENRIKNIKDPKKKEELKLVLI